LSIFLFFLLFLIFGLLTYYTGNIAATGDLVVLHARVLIHVALVGEAVESFAERRLESRRLLGQWEQRERVTWNSGAFALYIIVACDGHLACSLHNKLLSFC
jgi:hypothetical protein